jgi:hypothetical protein
MANLGAGIIVTALHGRGVSNFVSNGKAAAVNHHREIVLYSVRTRGASSIRSTGPCCSSRPDLCIEVTAMCGLGAVTGCFC